MADDSAVPVAKANMDPNFENRLRDHRTWAEVTGEELAKSGAVPWFRPEGWNRDINDIHGVSAPFNPATATQNFLDAVTDAKSPGTTGDVVATTNMVSALATMERAFRARHLLRRPRATVHASGRFQSHGAEVGVFTAAYIETMRRILEEGRMT